MTLIQVSVDNIKGVTLQCSCGTMFVIRIGDRFRCKCGKEYYCDFSLHVWENVVRLAPSF